MKSLRFFLTASVLFLSAIPSSVFAIQTVERFKPIEILIHHSQLGVGNVWDDRTVSGIIRSPAGATFNVNGFYHSQDLWMVRFAPDQIGVWRYQLSISDKNGQTQIIDSFQCIASSEQGFIRLHPNNPKRWIYSGTGNLYTPVGFGDCMEAPRDSIFQPTGLDGGYRPPGYHEGIEWLLPYRQYLTAYGDAGGYNIYRFSDGNCAYSNINNLSPFGNDYDTLHSRWTDTLFFALRQHGFRIYMTIMTGPRGSSADTNSMAATERYAQYCIDRYGSLVDFWELTNESNPDSLWISDVANYFHKNDPYHHLVSMSNPTPDHPAIDIISQHWYGLQFAESTDQVAANEIDQYQAIRKPVIFGEQGDGTVWDSLSGLRLRGRIWSALFNEGTLIFWNATFAKDCACNQYLGWDERRYAAVMQNYAALLDSDVRMLTPQTTGHLRIWGLQSPSEFALYIRNFHDVKEINSGIQIPINSPIYGSGYWYDVHSGDIIGQTDLSVGQQFITIPNFQTDIALIGRNKIPNKPLIDTLFRVDVNPRTEELLKIPIKTPLTFSVDITNTGKKAITLLRAWTSWQSALLTLSPMLNFPRVLNPSEKITLPVQYIMGDTGGTAATFSIEHDGSPAWENIAISATGIIKSSVNENESSVQTLKIFPDPAKDHITISGLPSDHRKTLIRISSVEGNIIAEKTLTSGKDVTFDVSKIPSGIYNITISSEDSLIAEKKLIIVH